MILKAAWIVPVSHPPIRNGYIKIRRDRIVDLGPFVPERFVGRQIDDLGHAVLTPGLVNAHTHLELGCYAGRLESAPFWDWLGRLVSLRREAGQEERETQAVADGAWQSLHAGVTCVGDISRRNLAWRRLKEIPIRKVCFVELLTLADHPPRNPDELRAAAAEIEEDPLLTVGVSPHTPFTVPLAQIRAAVELAHELQRPWCLHWAETREEVAYLLGQTTALPTFLQNLLKQCGVHSPGLTPAALLEHCARGLSGGALAHGNYASAADIAYLAETDHVVVYCPRAHHFFGHAPHPLPRLRAAGVAVALGTDSAASNENLALLEEARYVRRHVSEPPAADDLLRMVTLAGARALGLEDQIGSLEVGKQADLAAFVCAPDEPAPLAVLLDRPARTAGVWVAGRRVV
ncbi:MAG: amidohydrolase family protein [Planctomycetes bacterium]|nr:amidohydrolase family protein [Planctomycetota bacterium]